MTRYEEFRARDKERKEKAIQEFLCRVDVLKNNTDAVVLPSVEIVKESDNCYINYYVCKYPNCLVYSISLYKKDYPFSIYYTKEYRKNAIPKKYLPQFEELEKCFN